jgi:hypothetical protein
MTRTANKYLTETCSGWQACVHVSSAQKRSCARTTRGLTVTTFLSFSTAVEHWPLPADISVPTGPRAPGFLAGVSLRVPCDLLQGWMGPTSFR